MAISNQKKCHKNIFISKISMNACDKIYMINFDHYTNENKLKHNTDWPYIPDHPYTILIIGGSGSRKNKCII